MKLRKNEDIKVLPRDCNQVLIVNLKATNDEILTPVIQVKTFSVLFPGPPQEFMSKNRVLYINPKPDKPYEIEVFYQTVKKI